jgi:predicted dehydrogenase
MTAAREIGIAVVGTGTMARAHAYGYAAAPVTWSLPARPRLAVLCGRDTDGTLAFDYARLNELWLGRAREPRSQYGMTRIRAEEPGHPYAAHGWPIGQGAGYGASFVHQAGELLAAWPDGPWVPDLAAGLRVQEVCTAIETSASERRWCPVPAPGPPGTGP